MDAAEQIAQYIEKFDDWRGELLDRIRQIVLDAEPTLTEEWKWKSPVWSKNGLVCSASGFKSHVSINFFKGASLEDPRGLFNLDSDAKTIRTIQLKKGDELDEAGLKDLVRRAASLNVAS